MRGCLFLCALCACTQDFGAFDPHDGATSDSAFDGSIDSAVDASASDSGPSDVVTGDAVACTEAGAVLFGGHCYFLVAAPQTALAAKAACTAASAHLVTITGTAEETTVIALGAGTERWIGLFRTSGQPVDANYDWVTGEPRAGFSDWSPGEPNGSGQCVRLLSAGLWADDDCGNLLASICERE